MTFYTVDPLIAVTLEGVFGSIFTFLMVLPLYYSFGINTGGWFDLPNMFHILISNPPIWRSCIYIAFSISSFNYTGLSLSSLLSSTSRSTIDTSRTVLIYVTSLGLGWERWHGLDEGGGSWVQVAGFGMLLAGTLRFNGVWGGRGREGSKEEEEVR